MIIMKQINILIVENNCPKVTDTKCYNEPIYINKLIRKFKCWEFNCIGTNGFNNAQVTVGGIDTSQVNSSTLESKLVKNLYLCGEVLDVHGDCGGFNLQWAWSSGYLAAKSASSN